MKRFILFCLVTLILGVLAAISSLAYAQSGSTYDLSWNTIDGGGHTFSTGSGYELGGTVGQADAGVFSGGGYTLSGGFGGSPSSSSASRIYLPLVLR